MYQIVTFGIALLVVQCINCDVLPVDKCKLEDSSCLIPAFQKALPVFAAGMPELGVEALDVLDFDDVAFDLSGLHFTLKESKLKGLKTSVIDDVKWDLKKKTIDLKYHLDCSVKGHYTAGGRLLILPITGDGQMKLKLKNMEIHVVFHYEMEKDADGKEHVILNKYSFDFDIKDNAHFSLTNLFNGNKELSDTLLQFVNQNWKEVADEFGRPVIDRAIKKIFSIIKKFFRNVPITDIAYV